MSTDLRKSALFIAKNFISRNDVFAEQDDSGAYHPVRRKLKVSDIEDHVAGRKTYGHYLLDENSKTKILCLDIDLKKTGMLPTIPMPTLDTPVGPYIHNDSIDGEIHKKLEANDYKLYEEWEESFQEQDLRAAWLNRKHPARSYLKYSMRITSLLLENSFLNLPGIPVLTAYTGSKGLHVYGMLSGIVPADGVANRYSGESAREGARLVLDNAIQAKTGLPYFKKYSGESFWDYNPECESPISEELSLFSVEIYPKQSEVTPGNFGNLLRMPLGRNKRSSDPCFLVDTSKPVTDLTPLDLTALP